MNKRDVQWRYDLLIKLSNDSFDDQKRLPSISDFLEGKAHAFEVGADILAGLAEDLGIEITTTKTKNQLLKEQKPHEQCGPNGVLV